MHREEKIKNQVTLCNCMMQKIYEDCILNSAGCTEKGYIPNYTKIQNNIIHLRNELSDLSKLFNNT